MGRIFPSKCTLGMSSTSFSSNEPESLHAELECLHSPLAAVGLVLRVPSNFFAMLASGLLFGATYSLSFTGALSFAAEPYDYNSLKVGLVLLAFGLGNIVRNTFSRGIALQREPHPKTSLLLAGWQRDRRSVQRYYPPPSNEAAWENGSRVAVASNVHRDASFDLDLRGFRMDCRQARIDSTDMCGPLLCWSFDYLDLFGGKSKGVLNGLACQTEVSSPETDQSLVDL